ncbi:elongation factor Tu-3 [Streptomyces inusitatus]|uniref:Elongation factor Tu n=1 Tax=Streptomyces inusitatus TaxID=68221 RepID=A0A918QJS4_9ACTN|nr:GTP-binding protein [Streptomyces inusitatus]GGZ55386.1 elongation factor Tu-3 [Streptomyces inusitatus]
MSRTKPHLNIGTIGHTGHGKTTLTAALAETLGGRGAGRALEEARRGGTTDIARAEYETDTRHYAHIDLPGRADLIENMAAGAARLDGAILVVSAPDGVMPQTAEHVLLARQAGVDHVVVALNKAEAADDEPADLVEREVRELLTAHGYGGGTTPVVRVSALRALEGDPRWTASVEALLDAVDTYVPIPVRSTGAPFLLPVEGVLTVAGRGTAVTGAVERGTVRVGDRVELLGPGLETVVTALETFGTPLESAEAGDDVALFLPGLPVGVLHRGHTVAAPGSVTPGRRFTARVQLLPAHEGGRTAPIATGRRPRFLLRTAGVTGGVDLGGNAGNAGNGTARPGETVSMTVELDRALPLEPGLGFAVREDGRTVGAGTVTALL